MTWLPNLDLKLLEEVISPDQFVSREYVDDATALLLMVTEIREVQPENALLPMDCTLLGIITEVMPVHPTKA